MNFNTEAVNDLKVFHTQLNPEGEWNMSIDTLLRVCAYFCGWLESVLKGRALLSSQHYVLVH